MWELGCVPLEDDCGTLIAGPPWVVCWIMVVAGGCWFWHMLFGYYMEMWIL